MNFPITDNKSEFPKIQQNSNIEEFVKMGISVDDLIAFEHDFHKFEASEIEELYHLFNSDSTVNEVNESKIIKDLERDFHDFQFQIGLEFNVWNTEFNAIDALLWEVDEDEEMMDEINYDIMMNGVSDMVMEMEMN